MLEVQMQASKTEMVEKQEGQKLTGLDVLKGIAATGTILGGFAATQTRVYANDAVAVEKTVESKDTPGDERFSSARDDTGSSRCC